MQFFKRIFSSSKKHLSKSQIRIDRETFFEDIRINKLEGLNDFLFEINLEDERIKVSPHLEESNDDFLYLKDKLPPSFIKFIQNKANGIYIDIGNALTIFPVGKKIGTYWTDVLSLTNETIAEPLFPCKDFIFFGTTGGGDMFAFYTAFRFPNGEYPIVWVTPGLVDSEGFLFINSGFDKFLTIQYYLLKTSDYEETGTYEEMKKASEDKEKMKASETAWNRFHTELYKTFDPKIPEHNHDYDKSAMSFSDLNMAISEALKREE